jgi:hypothetical protein
MALASIKANARLINFPLYKKPTIPVKFVRFKESRQSSGTGYLELQYRSRLSGGETLVVGWPSWAAFAPGGHREVI